MKKCTKCGKEKPLDSFSKRKAMKDGHRSECKSCVCKDNKRRNALKPKRVRQDQQRKKDYGLNPHDFDYLFSLYNGKCHLCRHKFKNDKDTNVDHCHTTGRVRGLLCTRCNTALGKLGDTPEDLFRAYKYVS